MMAGRATMTATLSWGLVAIPMRLYSANESKSSGLTNLHSTCLAPLKFLKKCSACSQEIGDGEITKAMKAGGGWITLSQNEVDSLAPDDDSKVINVVGFVPVDDVDPQRYAGGCHFVAPDKAGARGYAALHRAMVNEGHVAIVEWVARDHDHIGVLRPLSPETPSLILHELRYSGELRIFNQQVPEFPSVVLNDAEVALATRLIETATGEFEELVSGKEDGSKKRLSELIAAKESGQVAPVFSAPTASAKVVDLM
jgi:DNA end-binding protein Ku